MKAYGTRAIRWGDNDRYLGPFTYSYSPNYRTFGVVLGSDVDEDVDAGTSSLRISIGAHTLIWVLPVQIVKPHLERHYPDWDEATVERIGRSWYDIATPREFGYSLSGGGGIGDPLFLQVFRGRHTHDSSTDRSWTCFLPWTEWRHVRRSFYGLEGEHLFDEEKYSWRLGDGSWEGRRAREAAVPTRSFRFRDFDGKELVATTKIEEMEWRFGRKPFEWLSRFRKPLVKRSLDLQFSDEVGPEKGSWKGGITGHSITMLPGDLHEAAFRRYCEKEHEHKGRKFRLTFIGEAQP